MAVIIMVNSSTTLDKEDFFPHLNAKDGPILSQDQLSILEDVYIGLSILVALAGSLTNALNIKTFLLIGKGDGVTVSLISLSLSDLGLCMCGLGLMMSHIARKIESRFDYLFPMDPWVIVGMTNNSGYAFYAMTGLTTTFLAVARCVCVARPLQFNHAFTRARCVVVHAGFAVVCIGGYVPLLSQMGAKRTFDARTNHTRLVAWFSAQREDIKDAVFLVFDTVLPFVCQAVIVVCVAVMADRLRRSAKFRQSAKTSTMTSNVLVVDEKILPSQTTNSNKGNNKLSGKERQVIQQVVLISSIFLVCSLPRVVNYFVYSLIDSYDIGQLDNNIYITIARSRKTVDLFNAASTYFIYYKYNSRFRELQFWFQDKEN